MTQISCFPGRLWRCARLKNPGSRTKLQDFQGQSQNSILSRTCASFSINCRHSNCVEFCSLNALFQLVNKLGQGTSCNFYYLDRCTSNARHPSKIDILPGLNFFLIEIFLVVSFSWGCWLTAHESQGQEVPSTHHHTFRDKEWFWWTALICPYLLCWHTETPDTALLKPLAAGFLCLGFDSSAQVSSVFVHQFIKVICLLFASSLSSWLLGLFVFRHLKEVWRSDICIGVLYSWLFLFFPAMVPIFTREKLE